MKSARITAVTRLLLVVLAGIRPVLAELPVTTEHMTVTGNLLYANTGLAKTVVLDQEIIRRLNKQNLPDILRTVPGLQINTQGGTGGLSTISIRGSEPNFVAVYIDDVLVNDPANIRGSGFQFHTINPLSIERIEIIKGPASVIHGSDAIAGVIRIFTRKEQIEKQGDFQVNMSAKGHHQSLIRVSDSRGNTSHTLGVAQLQAGNPDGGNNLDSHEMNFNLSHRYLTSDLLTVQLRYNKTERAYFPEQSGGPELATSQQREKSSASEQTVSVGSRNTLLQPWVSNWQLSHFRREGKLDSPGIAPFTQIPPYRDETSYTQTTVNWTNQLEAGSGLLFTFGTEYKYESGESDGVIDMPAPTDVDYTLKRYNHALYGHMAWQAWQAWQIYLGIRQDRPEEHDSQTTRQVRLQTPCFLGVVCLSASWGEGYKLPGFSALAHPMIGNAELEPETSESHELTFTFLINPDSTAEISFFANDYRNMVNFDSDTFQTVNRDRIETSGFDATLSFNMTDALSARLHGNKTRTDTHGSNAVLTGRPEHTAGLLVLWQASEQWEINTELRYNGSQLAETRHTGAAEQLSLAPYQTVNLHANWQANPATGIFLSVDNALNKHYYEAVGTPSTGRVVTIGLRSHW